jgi:hypothetical protein
VLSDVGNLPKYLPLVTGASIEDPSSRANLEAIRRQLEDRAGQVQGSLPGAEVPFDKP